ncbi:MAG: four helix bundle protein [Flavobacterium sp.]|uniref:four helix bundle protein n=1 Tax=Flavobacterium sp. TaxID=239 RepID=UPI00120B36E2|nr:four helix bundle protein [Flavobacterium sp.]RZJ65852.1 MAG: four helix bundle protein [Flavobacterium sp.]
MHRFRDLQIWKLSRKFCTDIYRTTQSFPDVEKFGLMNQLRRAAVSIPSNIAEGSSRSSNKDFCRFIEISLGSAYEVETQLLICHDLNYISDLEIQSLTTKLRDIIRMTHKFKMTLVN